MSGDLPCTLEAIWICPFCGRNTWKVETRGPPYRIKKIDGKEEEKVPVLSLRIECEDTMKRVSSLFDCVAMSEGGCYYLYIYPDGTCHAYYY